jgi:GntR family transcriptional regulator/MocR family aminotransferase
MTPRPLLRRADIADFLLPLDEASAVPLYRQVYEGVRNGILEGRLPPGARLPSTRRLAEYLDVSRTTVLVAFEQLVAEGFLEAAVGSGSRVASHVAPPRSASRISSSVSATPDPNVSDRCRLAVAVPRPARPRAPGPGAFRTGQPPVDIFPLDVWRRLAARCGRRLTTHDLFHGAAAGLPELRDAIVSIAVARGIRCERTHVMILASAQEAIDLTCRLLLDPGDDVWLEDPAWSGARAATVAAGARIVPVSVDREGLRVDDGIRASPGAKLVYVTPSHQYPMGVAMSLQRRMRLMAWAREHRAWIIEDDYDSEFRYAERPLAALRSLDGADRVLYVGTFNKTLFPALRLAYLILPDALIDVFHEARGTAGEHAPTIDQLVLTEFITGGHYARHLKQARAAGRTRRDALLSAAAQRLAALEFTDVDTGLHVVGWLPAGSDDRRVSAAALGHDVEAAPLSAFYIGACPRPGLVLGYGSLSTRQISDGVVRLARALDEAGTPIRSR